MSESEEIGWSERVLRNIRETQRNLYERKAKLGEDVVIADKDGKPLIVPASEALKLLDNLDKKSGFHKPSV